MPGSAPSSIYDCKESPLRDIVPCNEGSYYRFSLIDIDDDSGIYEDIRVMGSPILYSDDDDDDADVEDSEDDGCEKEEISEDSEGQYVFNTAFMWEKLSKNEDDFRQEPENYPKNERLTFPNAVHKYFLSRNLNHRRQRLCNMRNQQTFDTARERYIEVNTNAEKEPPIDVYPIYENVNTEKNSGRKGCVKKLHSPDSGINLYFDIKAKCDQFNQHEVVQASSNDLTTRPQTYASESRFVPRTQAYVSESRPIPKPLNHHNEFWAIPESHNINEVRFAEAPNFFIRPEEPFPFDNPTTIGNYSIPKNEKHQGKHVRFADTEYQDDSITTCVKPQKKQVRFNGVISVNGRRVSDEFQSATNQNCGLKFWAFWREHQNEYSTQCSSAKRAKKNNIKEKVTATIFSWLNRKLTVGKRTTKYISDIEAEYS